MKYKDFQEVYLERWLNQQEIGLNVDVDAYGYCAHKGKISFSFSQYFIPQTQTVSDFIMESVYDQDTYQEDDIASGAMRCLNLSLFANRENPDFSPNVVMLNEKNEHLDLQLIAESLKTVKKIEKIKNKKIYTALYIHAKHINVTLLENLSGAGLTELRIFSDVMTDIPEWIIREAPKYMITSVEEDMDPRFYPTLQRRVKTYNGIDHLILRSIKVTNQNEDKYKDMTIYKDLHYYLYDEGMVYRLIGDLGDVNFSVFDFNSEVERLIYPYYEGMSPFNFFDDDESIYRKEF